MNNQIDKIHKDVYSSIKDMRNFYLSYPICQTLSGKLSWSHYCELLSIINEQKRSFYEKETINANWSVSCLVGRQVSTIKINK